MKYSSEFSSSFENAALHTDIIISLLKNDVSSAPSHNMLFYIEFVIRELLNNAVEHGNGSDYLKEVSYCVEYSKSYFKITVYDEGEGFVLQDVLNKIDEDDRLRSRNRGLSTAIKTGWNITTGKGFVKAVIIYKEHLLEKGDRMMFSSNNDGEAIFKINKDITANNVKELIAKFESEIKIYKSVKKLIVDISDVLVIDSIGITFLIGLYKTVSNEGNSVSLTGCNKSIMEIMKIMKLDEIFGLN